MNHTIQSVDIKGVDVEKYLNLGLINSANEVQQIMQ